MAIYSAVRLGSFIIYRSDNHLYKTTNKEVILSVFSHLHFIIKLTQVNKDRVFPIHHQEVIKAGIRTQSPVVIPRGGHSARYTRHAQTWYVEIDLRECGYMLVFSDLW